ncbi:hypothetical protein M3611_23600 [Priestia megaterium]|uniref:hypothetical protein n=1 Tax=Priestia megaterium TaxID=1404 RepID=UPI00203D259B|nr:hypothetical protein [Priestia megaterium]MCM3155000.1 hypothetical protein [Priestia megaterium]
MSTLQRETNPKSGYAPSLLPQHERKDGAYVPTGENNPLPTAGYIQSSAGLWIPRKGTDDGSANVNIKSALPVGSNVIGKTVMVDPAGDGVEVSSASNSIDGSGTNSNLLYTASYQQAFNGSGWDRWRNNQEGLLLPSTWRTTATTSATQINHNAKGLFLCLDITAVPNATETLILEVKSLVNGNGSWAYANYTIPANTVGKFYLLAYPGISEKTINRVVQSSTVIPRSWYASVNHSGAGAWMYSLSFATIL